MIVHIEYANHWIIVSITLGNPSKKYDPKNLLAFNMKQIDIEKQRATPSRLLKKHIHLKGHTFNKFNDHRIYTKGVCKCSKLSVNSPNTLYLKSWKQPTNYQVQELQPPNSINPPKTWTNPKEAKWMQGNIPH